MLSTLRGRLAVLTTLVVAIAFALTGAIIVTATGREQANRLQRDMVERLALLEGAERAGSPPGRPNQRPVGRPPVRSNLTQLAQNAERALGRGFFVVIRDPDQRVVATFGDVPDTLPPATDARRPARLRADDGTEYLLLATTGNAGDTDRGNDDTDGDDDGDGDGTQSIQIGADVDLLVDEQQRELTQRVTLVGTAATLLTGLITFIAAGLAARPLRRLRQTTDEVAETEDLATRVDVGDAPSEILAVAEGFNTMMARLEASRTAREAALLAARRFAADAGHELRTPLTAMQADLDALERNPSLDAATRTQVVSEVAEESRRLATLIEALQLLARAEAGQLDVDSIDLADIVAESADAIRVRAPDVTVTVDLPDHDARLSGSAPWLRSIVDNLLVNSVLHGRPDGKTARISVRLHSDNGDVVLTVDDNGPGFDAADRDRVFERFARGADAHRRPGSGLGLALVAQLVALHGGQVAVGDAPSGGARVQVRFPQS